MFKRIERKRKRRDEEEELGLDEDAKEIMGLNETDSDESDSSSSESIPSEQESDPGTGEDRDDEENALSEEENPPISVEEALEDPIYTLSSDPTVYGCVLCKGMLIKNAGATIAHKNSKMHKRRFERFELLSANADPGSNAWEVVRATQTTSSVQASESEEPSKRALKRQARQTAIREKRKRHKELKGKAITKKAPKKKLANEKTGPGASSHEVNFRDAPESRNPLGKPRKKQK